MGLVGFLWGLTPGMRGSVLSLVAIFLSVVALVPAIMAMVSNLSNHL